MLEVTQTKTDSGIIFTADEGYTTYVWKVNNEKEQSGSNNVFEFKTVSLSNGIYDITLFAENETFHHSWRAQVTVTNE